MIYQLYNGAMQTTAAAVKVTTGTAIKTLLQLKPITACRIIEWGVSFDGSAAATPIEVELIDTGTVFGTVTAAVAADITGVDGEALMQGDPTSLHISVGTSATGYTCTSEGSITAVRNLSGPQLIAPTNQFVIQYPLGQEPLCKAANAVRIRVTAGAAVNAYAYMKVAF
jgi:hypothetical protein